MNDLPRSEFDRPSLRPQFIVRLKSILQIRTVAHVDLIVFLRMHHIHGKHKPPENKKGHNLKSHALHFVAGTGFEPATFGL